MKYLRKKEENAQHGECGRGVARKLKFKKKKNREGDIEAIIVIQERRW